MGKKRGKIHRAGDFFTAPLMLRLAGWNHSFRRTALLSRIASSGMQESQTTRVSLVRRLASVRDHSIHLDPQFSKFGPERRPVDPEQFAGLSLMALSVAQGASE